MFSKPLSQSESPFPLHYFFSCMHEQPSGFLTMPRPINFHYPLEEMIGRKRPKRSKRAQLSYSFFFNQKKKKSVKTYQNMSLSSIISYLTISIWFFLQGGNLQDCHYIFEVSTYTKENFTRQLHWELKYIPPFFWASKRWETFNFVKYFFLIQAKWIWNGIIINWNKTNLNKV